MWYYREWLRGQTRSSVCLLGSDLRHEETLHRVRVQPGRANSNASVSESETETETVIWSDRALRLGWQTRKSP